MRLVERMTQHPPTCLHCGRGNSAPEDEMPRRAIDLERDVNWGDSTYLCEECGAIIAGLLEFLSPVEAKNLRDRIDSLQKQLHDEKAARAEQKRRSDQIIAGKKALAEERKARREKVRS